MSRSRTLRRISQTSHFSRAMTSAARGEPVRHRHLPDDHIFRRSHSFDCPAATKPVHLLTGGIGLGMDPYSQAAVADDESSITRITLAT